MLADDILATGLRFLGTPYTFNAKPLQCNTFDCSSFVQYIFRQHGITLPRNSRQQFRLGTRVPLGSLQKGDLLFFTTERRKHRRGIEKIGHVGIYIGNGQMLHTSRYSGGVAVEPLHLDVWGMSYLGAKRIL